MRKLLVNKLFIVCLSALLFACLVAGITGAYYTAKNEATGSLIFDKGLIFEFTNITSDTTGLSGTLKYYENGDETTTPKSLVSISTDANATYVLAKPQILAKAKSTPFYARIKLETTFYTTNASGEYVSATASTLGAESEQAVYDALFAQNITFASRWQLAKDGYYYYCGEGAVSASASDLALINPNDTVDVFDNNVIQIGSWTSLFGGPYGISKVELLLTLDVVEQKGLTWSPEPLKSYIPLSGLTYTLNSTDKTMTITKIASGQTSFAIAPKYVIDGTTYTVTTIGNGSDAVNTTITQIELPDTITTIADNAFSGCTSLTNITISASVTTIGMRAFKGCIILTTVTIESGSQLTTIGGSAFSGCTELTNITIPASVTSIGEGAFFECSNLKTVTFESDSQLTSIGMWAFYGCSSLASITISANITDIYSNAFYGCTSLSQVVMKGLTPPTAGSYMFDDCDALTEIIVPTSAVEAYKSATGWSDYASIIVGGAENV